MRGLAKWTNEDENQIKLNFEPKGRSSRSYGVSKKENICVVCANTENHVRFYIVPYVYRALLPNRYKSHMSHDVVIVCGYCHINCEKYTQNRIKELEAICRPLGGYPPKYVTNQRLYQVRSCATALRQWKHKLPPEKIHHYELVVTTYLQNVTTETEVGTVKYNEDLSLKISPSWHSPTVPSSTRLSNDDLEFAMRVEYQIENPFYTAPSAFVVKKIASDGDQIEAFIRGWRQHFIDSNSPKFMPYGWSIDHPVRCDE